MNVYLHEIDIDESGASIILPCNISEYLIKFVFFTDSVLLQSSSALKVNDMQDFFLRHSDFFTVMNDEGRPYISFVLDPRFTSLSEYIDSRMGILSANSDKQNLEFMIYKENNAIDTAKKIDTCVNSGEFAHRKHDINVIFRNNLQNLEIAAEGDDIKKGIQIIDDYVVNNGFIQTFDILDRIDSTVANQNSVEILGRAIRNSYFRANAAAAGCEYHNRNWHLQYSNINQYSAAIGLNRLFVHNWKIDSFLVTKIKSLPSFQNLLDLYYSMSNHSRFCAFMTYIQTGKSNPLYHFHETSYFKKQKQLFKRDMDKLKKIIYNEERLGG